MVENEHTVLTPGTIYIAYQGIGKSSTVNESFGFIDLESSNFRLDDGYRPDEWYIYYGNLAFDLASQGYSVFTSSHEPLRKYLYELRQIHPQVNISIILPALELKNEWIQRLQDRYDKNPTKKNQAALMGATQYYESNIVDMLNDADDFGFNVVEIDTIDYKLIDVLPITDENVALNREFPEDE